MKRVMSISLGSSQRDAVAILELAGERCIMERIGTDGNKEKALKLFRRYRGKVDAFGLGGTDLYIYAGKRRYTFVESQKFLQAAGSTPVFDGSGLKNTLEKNVLHHLQKMQIVNLPQAKVLLVCGVDRAGMAQTFSDYGSDLIFGDLLFGLSCPLPIKSLAVLQMLTRCIAPIITKLPIRYFYPIGRAQEERTPKFSAYFQWADIIAGDFHFIRKYMPDEMRDKAIITNTVTAVDKAFLQASGVRLLVTTTPDFAGRSFGTNMIEAAIYATTGYKGGYNFAEMQLPEFPSLKPGIFYLGKE